MSDYDDIVIGTGMGGLTVGALLAREGRRVLLLEAHDVPGGYAHTFRMREYRFCAQVHYIFNCGEGESIHAFLSEIGLADEVPFVRLDSEGFDHVIVGDERLRIPNGWPKFRDRMIRRWPEAAGPLREYFRVVAVIADELDRTPDRLSPLVIAQSVYRQRHLIRYLRWTLEDLYDCVRRAIRSSRSRRPATTRASSGCGARIDARTTTRRRRSARPSWICSRLTTSGACAITSCSD